MIHPLVSIIITSYNREKYIGQAIQSALDQDYPNLEVIISDNHSSDGTDAIVKKHIHDKRVKHFVNETNIGLVPNFKIATEERAKGQYLTYVSSDDYLSNKKFISTAIELINKYPNIILVTAKNATLDEKTNEIVSEGTEEMYKREFEYGEDLFKLFYNGFSQGWGGVLMDREKLIKTRALDSRSQSMDYEAMLKLMLQGNVAFIKEITYVFRKHDSNASGFVSYEAQINSFDFIDNTCDFAKKMGSKIDIDAWKKQVYFEHLNGIIRRLVHNKSDVARILHYVKSEKKVQLSFSTSPKLYLLFILYKNYNALSFFLKLFHSSLYHSIEKDRKVQVENQLSISSKK